LSNFDLYQSRIIKKYQELMPIDRERDSTSHFVGLEIEIEKEKLEK
jgi:hypothetical protein